MTANPSNITTGESVMLAWKDAGGYKPKSNDWIGYYCGDDLSNVADTAYLDWVYVTVDSGYASGHGSESVEINSARKPQCEFRIFNHEDNTSYHKIGTSNEIKISDARSHVHHLHLALT